MRRTWIVSTTVAAAIVLVAVAFAQAEPFGEMRDRPRDRDRTRLRERIELMKMWKLTEVLDLDEATAAKLFPLLQKQEAEQRELRDKRHAIFGEIKAEVEKEDSDPKALRKMVDAFKQNERDIVDLRNKRLDELSELLSEEQIAKMILFVPRFEREVRGLMWDVRSRHRHDGRGGRMESDPMEGGPMGSRFKDAPPEPDDLPPLD